MNAIKFLMELDEFYQNKIKVFKDNSYEVPYTTMNVGVINGGSAKNSVSANCNVVMDFRIVKKEHINKIKEKIEELSNKYNCKNNIIECVEPFINKISLIKEIKTSNFITEASFINAKNKMILGPGPVTAHEVNEYITNESYEKTVEQYIEIIEKVCN